MTADTTPSPSLPRELASAFCGKLKQSQKADAAKHVGIALDYELPPLERDKAFLRAVVNLGRIAELQAVVSAMLPSATMLPPSLDGILRAIDSCGGTQSPGTSDEYYAGYNAALAACELEVRRIWPDTSNLNGSIEEVVARFRGWQPTPAMIGFARAVLSVECKEKMQ